MARERHSPGYRWAAANLLASPGARAAWTFQEKLERSQWYTSDQHRELQDKRLRELLVHAIAKCSHYRRSLAGLDPLALVANADWDAAWRRIPIVTRSMLQADPDAFAASDLPAGHGDTTHSESSGSTGRTITIVHSAVSATWHRAMTLRSQLWATTRFDRRLATIRRYDAGTADYPEGFAGERWASDTVLPFNTGPVAGLTVATPLHQQIEWMERQRPDVLVTYPSNLEAMCRFAERQQLAMPRLQRILTLGEALPEGIRGAANRTFGATIADTYSAAEAGEIAIQCPETNGYHVQCEAVLVEVVNENGRPCRPGETGRLLLTPLHNYATPLIRYEIGDLATVAKPCSCGRGLPVLGSILGRHRNMMMAPDGSLFWPAFGLKHYHKIAPVLQGRFVQHTLDDLEAIFVVERPLTAGEEEAIRAQILRRMPGPMRVRFTYSEGIGRGESGKFEEFVSLVAKPDSR